MQPIFLDDIDAPALAELHALNEAHAVELSPMDAVAFEALVRAAWHARRVRGSAAFLLALDHDATYDSPNFSWFKQRYGRFAYVDRIVVPAADRGRGLARALYADLFLRAATRGLPRVACEVNVLPPNPLSDAFHASLGFAEVGRERLEDRGKTVRYLVRELGAAA